MKIKAVILAAGFGTRMGHYTKDLPKPLLPIGGRPLIEHTIKQLKRFGVTDIGLNLHYHADKIKQAFGSGENLGVNLTYVYEDAPSGTAGGVKKLENFLSDADHIIVIYGDILCDLNYGKLLEFHLSHGGQGTVCVHQRKKSNSIVEFDQTMKISQFIERPDEETLKRYTQGFWVNSAIYCLKSEVLDQIPTGVVSDFPKDIFPRMVSEGQLFAYKLDANRYAIDSEEKYLEAISNFSKFDFK